MSIQVYGNKTTASWSYQRFETVSVLFHLSLNFFEPSQLQNQTTEVTDMQSHTFTLEGVRSCDYFKLCVGASNIVGQGDDSCIEGSLPYIPPVDMITKSLSRVTANTNFTLTVTIIVRQV